jgi:hypothetical protein
VETRNYADGTFYCEGPRGLRIEVPLVERIDVILAREGWLGAGDLNCTLAGRAWGRPVSGRRGGPPISSFEQSRFAAVSMSR